MQCVTYENYSVELTGHAQCKNIQDVSSGKSISSLHVLLVTRKLIRNANGRVSRTKVDKSMAMQTKCI